jgi:Ca2+/Na+ antiporter
MNQLAVVAADVAAITLLAFGVYFPRHHRRDLLTAFIGVNLGVVAVSLVLGSATVGLGLGLGLFGVLSIIRLRSDEIAQHEIAYYFASLALGLVAGITGTVNVLAASLMLFIVGGLYIVDHPRLLRRHRLQTIRLDRAEPDPEALRQQLAQLLGGRVLHVTVKSLDLANDTTLVEVRYVADRVAAPRATRPEKVAS